MKPLFQARPGEKGFSLVELMVSITIGLIILAAVSAMLVNSKKSYSTQDRLARVQENGRFAIQYILKDLRLAGYYGCADDLTTVNNQLNAAAGTAFDVDKPIEGYDSGGAQWYPSGVATKPTGMLTNTDSVLVRMLDPSTAVTITKEMPSTSAEIDVNTVAGFSLGDIIMITDCASSDLMQVTQVQAASIKLQHNGGGTLSPGNSSQKLSKAYGTSAKIMKYVTRRYYIRTGSSGNPALYRDTNWGSAEELVDGIEDLQILYGKDTDSDKIPNVYLKAGDAGLQTTADWSNVISVRIGILSRSVNQEDSDIDKNTYDLPGKTVAAQNDHNKRRVFVTTTLLRNLQ